MIDNSPTKNFQKLPNQVALERREKATRHKRTQARDGKKNKLKVAHTHFHSKVERDSQRERERQIANKE